MWLSSRGGFGVAVVGAVAEHGVEDVAAGSGRQIRAANAARKNARLSWRLPVRAGCSPLIEDPALRVTGAMHAKSDLEVGMEALLGGSFETRSD
jgi:hypothetical protein